MRQREDGMEDDNVLASLKGEKAPVTPEVKDKLTDFVLKVFSGMKGN